MYTPNHSQYKKKKKKKNSTLHYFSISIKTGLKIGLILKLDIDQNEMLLFYFMIEETSFEV